MAGTLLRVSFDFMFRKQEDGCAGSRGFRDPDGVINR
jgi:hypothetical protein